jgi:hypothetical protein
MIRLPRPCDLLTLEALSFGRVFVDWHETLDDTLCVLFALDTFEEWFRAGAVDFCSLEMSNTVNSIDQSIDAEYERDLQAGRTLILHFDAGLSTTYQYGWRMSKNLFGFFTQFIGLERTQKSSSTTNSLRWRMNRTGEWWVLVDVDVEIELELRRCVDDDERWWLWLLVKTSVSCCCRTISNTMA